MVQPEKEFSLKKFIQGKLGSVPAMLKRLGQPCQWAAAQDIPTQPGLTISKILLVQGKSRKTLLDLSVLWRQGTAQLPDSEMAYHSERK